MKLHDLRPADGAHTLAAQVRNLIGDKLDIVVANAGISKSAPIEDVTVQDFDDLFAVNVRAPYFLVQQLLPVLGEGSSVILVSSLGARTVRTDAEAHDRLLALTSHLPHALANLLMLRVAEAVALEHAPMPGYPTAPDLDRLLLAISLRPDDFDAVTREVDGQLERIADLLGVEA